MTRTLALFLLVLVCLSATAFAQDDGFFPEQRLEELRREIVFQAPEGVAPPVRPEAPVSYPDLSALRRPAIVAIGCALAGGLGLLGYLIYRSARRGRSPSPAPEEISIGTEALAEEEMVRNGVDANLLSRAESAGEYSLAVRLLYLNTLQQLNAAALIRYRKDLGNRDYLHQLQGHSIRQDFGHLTRDYERYWYGQYPLDALTYRSVRSRFHGLADGLPAPPPTPAV
ncbi:uncharacterized protein DUF4129 [Neolewinella xylanilytica]|uniref:Uncharacterized protein DUF4129 n=1 Tax=Neolewinella xylanilytica TaxID=1514080 RepID=A0A2S6I7S0_9BACT|nr:DUF4129 domain-containing protein [Neolewinella xylanilytica]PPK87542.1 uncharacterized protein DUF4129 [Neolewinella xylanilytica]